MLISLYLSFIQKDYIYKIVWFEEFHEISKLRLRYFKSILINEIIFWLIHSLCVLDIEDFNTFVKTINYNGYYNSHNIPKILYEYI